LFAGLWIVGAIALGVLLAHAIARNSARKAADKGVNEAVAVVKEVVRTRQSVNPLLTLGEMCEGRAYLRQARVLLARNMAELRGLSLLREWLTHEQRRQFDLTEAFEVRGCDSHKRYLIRHGTGTSTGITVSFLSPPPEVLCRKDYRE